MPSKDRTSLFDGQYFRITPDIGKHLLTWLDSGVSIPQPLAESSRDSSEKAVQLSLEVDPSPAESLTASYELLLSEAQTIESLAEIYAVAFKSVKKFKNKELINRIVKAKDERKAQLQTRPSRAAA
jgi:hypothetical protein